MKLVAKYDIEAPVDFVYRELADYDAWERMAIRRGAEVTRLDTLVLGGAGMTWQVSFPLRGKERNLGIRIARDVPASQIALALTSALFDGEIALDLLDLAAKRTRIEVRLDVKPKTLPAKLYIQTLRLARKKVDRGYAQRVAQLAVELEDRYRRLNARQMGR